MKATITIEVIDGETIGAEVAYQAADEADWDTPVGQSILVYAEAGMSAITAIGEKGVEIQQAANDEGDDDGEGSES